MHQIVLVGIVKLAETDWQFAGAQWDRVILKQHF